MSSGRLVARLVDTAAPSLPWRGTCAAPGAAQCTCRTLRTRCTCRTLRTRCTVRTRCTLYARCTLRALPRSWIPDDAIEVQASHVFDCLPGFEVAQIKISQRLAGASGRSKRQFVGGTRNFDSQREVVSAVSAAFAGFESEIPALGTLHSGGRSADASSSNWRWTSARSWSASRRSGSAAGIRSSAASASRSRPLAANARARPM